MVLAADPMTMVTTAGEPAAPAIVFTDSDFARWARLLEQRTGIVVPTARKAFLTAQLRVRMAELEMRDGTTYFEQVLSGPRGSREWAELVDRLTVQETHFFRHPPSIEAVRSAARAFLARDPEQRMHVWSAGCATGEEAYTLALAIDDVYVQAGSTPSYGVIATDVSLAALAHARHARYRIERLSEIPAEFRQRYTAHAERGWFAFTEPLRKRIGFAQLNLLELARASVRDLDVIFCQNVLIYFARSTRTAILNQLVDRLRPGGQLILGPNEVAGWVHASVERTGPKNVYCYTRLPGP